MPSFLVTGATGNQGGAVVDYLLAAGAKVHAVVRDPSSTKAAALKDKGVVLFKGTHEEPDEVFRAAASGCAGFFFNPTIFEPGKARAQADAIIAATKAGGGSTLTSIVLSSTYRTKELSNNSATCATIHPFLGGYYAAKAEVEAAVRESGIRDYTILRPPVLNYDLLLPASGTSHTFPKLPRAATLVTSLKEGLTMPYLDERDIGKITSAALHDPAKFSGQEIELAADNLTTREVADTIARVSGIEIKVHERTPEEREATKNTEFFQVFEGLTNKISTQVDVKGFEDKYGIRLTRLEEYFERNKELLMESLPPKALVTLGEA